MLYNQPSPLKEENVIWYRREIQTTVQHQWKWYWVKDFSFHTCNEINL